MVVIRLRRAGSKKRPFFRIVVTEHHAPRDGAFLEVLGTYNPRTNPESLTLNREKSRVAVIASGGNIDLQRLKEVLG